ncbi:uncharacterized protein LOC132725768 [Ruditapes philippinarum]|uniref:uncharacterized protein LOC132725768 n=1 Tax=Ruditapes philippinarum TaxID=129788 RepID=UPI00295A9BFB|nr:uncharacterized protein LOC132725768 [Ruditapes philippinarum]
MESQESTKSTVLCVLTIMYINSERYDFKDEEVGFVIKTKDDVNEKLTSSMILEDLVPATTYMYKSQAFKELEASVHKMIEGVIWKKFKEAESTFNKDDIRHFADHLILARMEAEDEEDKMRSSDLMKITLSKRLLIYSSVRFIFDNY